MKAYVFTDKALASYAGRFVWLAMDWEKSTNASLHKKFPVQALPTFFIVDPAEEKVTLRWVGGATVPQLTKILDDGLLAVAQPASGIEHDLAEADRAYGEANYAEAAHKYVEVLAQAPAGWPRYNRAVESLLFAYQSIDSSEACARLAHEALPKLGRTLSAASTAAGGLGCALQLPPEHPARAAWIAEFETASRDFVRDTTLEMAGDDRSGIYIGLLDAREDAKDSLGARQVAEQWSAFLDGAAARARTPDQRAVYDSHRLSAYIELGKPELAIPMLEASERDLPNDYNPPARLANAYKAMKEWDKALAASDRALAKAYGPRKLGILRTRAEIYQGKGDNDAARRTIQLAISEAEALPDGQKSDATIASLKKKLESIQ